MKPTPIFISHLGLQHIQKQKNSKRVGYIDCLYYNRMTLKTLLPIPLNTWPRTTVFEMVMVDILYRRTWPTA